MRNTQKNKTPDDNTPDDYTPYDNTPDDKTPENNTPDDNTLVVIWGVVIRCCHLKLSSEVTRSLFYLFIKNFIHSFVSLFIVVTFFHLY
jgi:hypothetical protein